MIQTLGWDDSIAWFILTTVALSSTEAEYVVLILALKEAIWLQLLLIELGLLLLNNQYAKIKVAEGNKSAKKIKANLKSQEEEDNKEMALKAAVIHLSTSIKTISLKSDNQGLIALAHNLVYYTQTKHIDI